MPPLPQHVGPAAGVGVEGERVSALKHGRRHPAMLTSTGGSEQTILASRLCGKHSSKPTSADSAETVRGRRSNFIPPGPRVGGDHVTGTCMLPQPSPEWYSVEAHRQGGTGLPPACTILAVGAVPM